MDMRSVNSSLLSIGRWLRRGADAVGRQVFPPICLGCGALVGTHGGVCADCWRGLRFIEKPLCDVLGTPFAHDMGDGLLSAEAIADPPPFRRVRSAVQYDALARAMVHRLKYNDRTDLAPVMARWMARAGASLIEEADCLLSVPLHRRRLLARRYNQAAELARALSAQTGRPYLSGALIRRKATRSQVGLAAPARTDNVRGAFEVPDDARSALFGRAVVLVDDVYTTGATVKAVTRTLLRAGAGHVSVLTFARVVPGARPAGDGTEPR